MLEFFCENNLSVKILYGESFVLVHHIGFGISALGNRGRAGIDVGHAVLFLHAQHMRVAMNEQIAVLVRRQGRGVELMSVSQEHSDTVCLDEGIVCQNIILRKIYIFDEDSTDDGSTEEVRPGGSITVTNNSR